MNVVVVVVVVVEAPSPKSVITWVEPVCSLLPLGPIQRSNRPTKIAAIIFRRAAPPLKKETRDRNESPQKHTLRNNSQKQSSIPSPVAVRRSPPHESALEGKNPISNKKETRVAHRGAAGV